MAATFNWCEDNGTSTGSPAHGTTRSQNATPPTDVSWKNTDDAKTSGGGTAYSASPVTAGNNSFEKYQYGQYSGSFNQISAGTYAHSAGTLPTGCTLKALVSTTYATPSATTDAGLTNDLTTSPSSTLSVNFHTTGPEGASPTSTLSAAGFTQYLRTQLQTTGSAPAGDTASQTMQLVYNEN